MSDNSPNSLHIQPSAKKSSRKVLAVVAFLGFIIIMVTMSGFGDDESKKTAPQETKETTISDEAQQSFVFIDGSGLATEEREKPVQGIIGSPEPELKQEIPLEPIVVIQGQGLSEEEQHIRNLKRQAYFAALNSPLLAKKVNTPSAIVSDSNYTASNTLQRPQAPSSATQLSPGSPDAYDPSADKDKEAFFERSNPDRAWLINDVRTAGQPYEMKSGTVIPGVMVTGVNSDLPGTLIAQVSQNIYDSTKGEYLLIPQGSKLYGVYDSRVIFGQSRVLVAWNRIIFPDGSALTLPAMPGTDMAGNAGFSDKTNSHFFKTFGSAVMMALITAGTSYAVDTASGDSGDNENSLTSQMTGALAQQLGQTTTRLLEKNLNVKPTLEVRPGYQFNIVLTKDVAFAKPYAAWR